MKGSRAARADTVLFALFALFLFSSAFSIALSQASLGLALIVFIGIMVARRENPFTGPLRPLYSVIGLYVLWMLVSPLFGPTPLKSFLMEREDWLFAVIPIGIHLMSRESYRNRLLPLLGVAVLIVSVYGSIQHFTGLHWPRTDLPTPTPNGRYFAEGTFANKLTYGNYLATAVPFLLGWLVLERTRWPARRILLFGAAVPAGIAAIVLSYSRTAAAAIPAVILILAGLRSRRWLLGAVAVLAVLIPVALLVPGVAERYELAIQRDFAGDSEAARVHVWEKSLGIVRANPVFGVGHGHFPENYALQNDPAAGEHRVFPHAHNDLLNVAAVTGLPGAALFAAMWVVVLRLLLRGRRVSPPGTAGRRLAGAAVAASISFLICSITEATFADEEVRQILMFVWAAGLWPLANKPASRGATAGIKGEIETAKTT